MCVCTAALTRSISAINGHISSRHIVAPSTGPTLFRFDMRVAFVALCCCVVRPDPIADSICVHRERHVIKTKQLIQSSSNVPRVRTGYIVA